MNAAVALRTLEAAGLNIPPPIISCALRDVQWPARFQDTGHGFILDGGHNPEAAQRLVQTWRELYGDRKTEVILGIVRDKDAQGVCAQLATIAERFTVVPVRSPRAGNVDDLLAITSPLRPSRICASLAEAIASTPRTDPPALITGSLFLMGEALVLLGLAEPGQEISAQ
jgi:dihydrofolate synthase/folylpolyglutamate synthase